MIKKLLWILVLMGFFAATASADTLYLKNGKIINGKIVKERKYSIKIEVNGFPYTYYLEEIERIEKDENAPEEEAVKFATKKTASEIIAEVKNGLAKRLLEVNGTRESLTQVFDQAISTAPIKIRAQLREIMVADQIIEQIIPIYTNEFDQAELKELVSFYSSPTGQKYHQKSPELLKLMMEETVKYFNAKVRELESKSSSPAQP